MLIWFLLAHFSHACVSFLPSFSFLLSCVPDIPRAWSSSATLRGIRTYVRGSASASSLRRSRQSSGLRGKGRAASRDGTVISAWRDCGLRQRPAYYNAALGFIVASRVCVYRRQNAVPSPGLTGYSARGRTLRAMRG